MFILLSLLFVLTLIVAGNNEFNYLVSNLSNLIVLFAFVIAISNLLDLLNIVPYNYLFQINKISDNSAPIDINFAILPLFFGVICVLYSFRKPNSKLKLLCYNFFLLFFSFTIVLSGSRRGLIVFTAIIVFLLAIQIPAFNNKNQFIKRTGLESRFFLVIFFILIIFSTYFIFFTSYAFQNKVLEFFGSKKNLSTKQNIASNLRKYTLIKGKFIPFDEFYLNIWPVIPEDPDSGWGIRVHKTIFPLEGRNSEIIPKGIKGYLLDKTCEPSYYPDINLYESYTLIVKLNVTTGEKFKASVYCFVSDDFDGNTVSLGCSNLTVAKGIVTGKPCVFYDLKNKGTWQKLEIEFNCNDGYAPIGLSFTKNGETDFSKLNGYVIFAYPQYEKINKQDSTLSLLQTINKNTHSDFRIAKNNVETPIKDISKTSTLNTQEYYLSSILSFPLSILFSSSTIQNDNDPIRNFASKLVSEDTTYYPYKSNIILPAISNAFIGDRVLRWQFATQIFSKEYTITQKLFGGGFNFLNWYGYYFLKDKTASDWPHNPFLSILLYSGIVGLLIYCFFLYKVFYYYIKYIKEYPLLFIFFLITFFFTFFSGGSPFDPPVFGFFSILPFFIHSVHKREALKEK
jgi:hypothetical protein